MLKSKQSRLVTIVGVLIPLSAVGGAAIMELENAGLVAATSESGLLGRIGANLGKDGGEGGEAGDTADPDAIVSSGQPAVPAGGVTDPPPQIQPAAPPTPIGGSTPVVVRPGGNTPKVNNPTFIGNVLWVAPGIMTSMSNGVWQESKAATNPEAKSDLNSEAVVDYLTNASAVLISYNDALLTQNDNASIQNFLAVLAGGSFIETNWSQAIFETALSADVISRQINTAWQSPSVGGTYVSYTQLHDNVNGTICNSTHIGVRSTQVCADTGVYYLNMLDTTGWYPTIVGPPGFSDMMTFGIMPWWPVSASATAYRLMNPDGNVVPPIITTTNDSIFADFMSDFAATDTYEIVSSIGQMPGSWSFPIW